MSDFREKKMIKIFLVIWEKKEKRARNLWFNMEMRGGKEVMKSVDN